MTTTTTRSRVPNRTRTDDLIRAIQECETVSRGGWCYLDDLAHDIPANQVRLTVRFLVEEYDALDFLPGCDAVKIKDLARYETGDRLHDGRWLWPQERP